jgi:GAF domain-containing protein
VTPQRTDQAAVDRSASHEIVPLLLDYLDDVALRTAERMGPVGGVAVTMEGDTDPMTLGSSSDLAYAVDHLQYSIGKGPCLHALHTGERLYVPDLAEDDRWDDYGPRAAALGAACCLSLPVRVGGRVEAVLKVYGGKVDGISSTQQDLLTTVGVEISGGIALARRLTEQARELDDRAAAMDTRRVIDLALGILMERTSCDARAAFELLRRYSQTYNVKLNAAARQILHTMPGANDKADQAPFNPHADR